MSRWENDQLYFIEKREHFNSKNIERTETDKVVGEKLK